MTAVVLPPTARNKSGRARLLRRTNKLWVILKIALDDLKAIERSEFYSVDMTSWHAPRHKFTRSSNLKLIGCSVCLAGAVMAHTLDCPSDAGANPDDFLGDDELTVKLWALDALREGRISSANRYVHGDNWRCELSAKKVSAVDRLSDHFSTKGIGYDVDRAAWWKGMRFLLAELRKEDL